MYALCGNDIVDDMRGITHRTGILVLAHLCEEGRDEAEKNVLAQLVSLGTGESVEDDSIVMLERFICMLYNTKEVRLDAARVKKLGAKTRRRS